MEITRETVWTSNIIPDNIHRHKIKNLNSVHLANIIWWVSNSLGGHTPSGEQDLLHVLTAEVEKRELAKAFIDKAPYSYDPDQPYQEYHDGF